MHTTRDTVRKHFKQQGRISIISVDAGSFILLYRLPRIHCSTGCQEHHERSKAHTYIYIRIPPAECVCVKGNRRGESRRREAIRHRQHPCAVDIHCRTMSNYIVAITKANVRQYNRSIATGLMRWSCAEMTASSFSGVSPKESLRCSSRHVFTHPVQEVCGKRMLIPMLQEAPLIVSFLSFLQNINNDLEVIKCDNN